MAKSSMISPTAHASEKYTVRALENLEDACATVQLTVALKSAWGV